MTANQIAWWNIQEQIRSHQQNELNERNKNAITNSLGNEQNRIANERMENDFVLGQQGNRISQQQADASMRQAATAERRARQDYDIGLKTVANQTQRNAQDYEIGTRSNEIKAADVSNNFILGKAGQAIQSLRNAQDFAIGKMQQTSYSRMADAAQLTAGTKLAELRPTQAVVALTAADLQKLEGNVSKATTKAVKKAAQNVVDAQTKAANTPKPVVTAPIKGLPVQPRVVPQTSTSNKPKTQTKSTSSKSQRQQPRPHQGGKK